MRRQGARNGNIHEVQRDDERQPHVEELEREVEVPLEPRRVHHRHDGVGLPVEQRLARHPLVLGRGPQRVGPGQVHDADLLPLEPRRGQRDFHRLAGIVGRRHAHAREPVEEARLADIGVAGQREPDGHVFAPAGDGAVAAGHRAHPPLTKMCAATFLPSA